jgi:hypothetical protein
MVKTVSCVCDDDELVVVVVFNLICIVLRLVSLSSLRFFFLVYISPLSCSGPDGSFMRHVRCHAAETNGVYV